MRWKRALLCMACALLLMLTVFKPGYRIIVDGTALSGIYAPEVALRCAEAADRAACELSDGDAPYKLIPVLCLRHTQADEARLCGTLLRAWGSVIQVSTSPH